jgi:hypothetical protein
MSAGKVDIRFDPEAYTLCDVPGFRLAKECPFPGIYIWTIEYLGEGRTCVRQLLVYYVGTGVGGGGIGKRVWDEAGEWKRKLKHPRRHRDYFRPLNLDKIPAGVREPIETTSDEEFNRHIIRQGALFMPMIRVYGAHIENQSTALHGESEIIHRLGKVGGPTFEFLSNKNKDRYARHDEIGEITMQGRKIIGLTADVPSGLE